MARRISGPKPSHDMHVMACAYALCTRYFYLIFICTMSSGSISPTNTLRPFCPRTRPGQPDQSCCLVLLTLVPAIWLCGKALAGGRLNTLSVDQETTATGLLAPPGAYAFWTVLAVNLAQNLAQNLACTFNISLATWTGLSISDSARYSMPLVLSMVTCD